MKRKTAKKDGKKGKGKGGKKTADADEEKKEEKKEEVKLDKNGKPICKGPAKEKDVQLEESDSDDEQTEWNFKCWLNKYHI